MKTGVRALVLALLIVGFFAWQTAQDHSDEQEKEDCQMTAAFSGNDDDC